jgi:hypothetical protein
MLIFPCAASSNGAFSLAVSNLSAAHSLREFIAFSNQQADS